ncbi:hypothetical protein EZV62_007159 [Acer yangbiense]|uniref:NB-ARC domain-containing protein n=1 Tax=Acer yangbiense TaxID=1000413 RepID=A0A5C7I9M7_9ROSI|nr:hypothetical protein EZV62_007159 [Acer yangbiense]
MTEIAISVAAKVAEYLVAPIARPFGYLWNHKSNFENLKNEVKKLEGRRDYVRHSVEDARRNGEEIEKHVESWLDNVKNTIDEVSELINGDDHHLKQQADMKCFKGFSCTNLKKLYQHSQKAARLKAGVAGVREEAGKFEKVSYRTIPEETWIESSNNYKAFEARKYILKNIIDALSNPDIDRVGIYGMGGIGKTTLAKEFVRQSKQDELFGEIAFVQVSQTLDIKKIQEEIANKLSLEFCEKTDSGRARRLCDRLKKEEKILLVLDKIWGSLDFEKVGIPFESN